MTEQEEIIEEDDFLADLLDEGIENQKFGGKEEIAWAPVAFDPVKKIASVLERSDSKNRIDHEIQQPYFGMLASYFANGNMASAKTMLTNEHVPSMQTFISFLAAKESIAKHHISVKERHNVSFDEYVVAFSRSAADSLERLFSIETGEFVLEEEKKTPVVEEIIEEYQNPLFTGFSSESLIAAHALKPLTEGYEHRLQFVNTIEEISRLIFIGQSAQFLPKKESSNLQKMINDPEQSLEDITTRVIIGLGLKHTKKLRKMKIEDAIEQYNRVLRSRFGYTQDILKQFEEMESKSFDYEDIAKDIVMKLRERKGLYLFLGDVLDDLYDEEDYEKFKRELLHFEISMYKKTKKAPEMNKSAITVKALKGNAYADGTLLNGLPLGTLGFYDGDEFRSELDGYDFDLDPEEIVLAEELEFDIENLEAGRRKATVINGEKYKHTKKGSWGYIVGKGRDNNHYEIEFHHIPGFGDRLPRNYADIEKIDVNIEEIDEEAVKKKNEEIEKITGGLLKEFESIIKEAEGEYAQQKQWRKELITSSLDTFRAMGIPEGVITWFFYNRVKEYRDIISEDALQERTIFEEINEFDEVSYANLAWKVLQAVKDEMKLIIRYPDATMAEKEYVNFKENLSEYVFKGYRIIEGQKKKFKKGQKVVLLEKDKENGYKKNTIAKYKGTHSRGGDCHWVNIEGYNVNIECKLAPVEKAFHFDEIFRGEMRAGAKVKLRKDSEFYGCDNQIPKEGGILKQNFGDGGRDALGGWATVEWQRGCNSYHERDLILANPLEKLRGAAKKKYDAAVAEQNKMKEEINNTLTALVKKIEVEHNEIMQEKYKMIDLAVDTLRSMGFEDEYIKQECYRSLNRNGNVYIKELFEDE